MRNLIFILLFLVGINTVNSQVRTIQIIDSQTASPISFVKINDGTSTFMADIDGKIELELSKDRSYTFRFFEYKDTIISGEILIKSPTVLMVSDAQMLEEFIVYKTDNPAHRIIRNVMEHKKDNNPLRNNSFNYQSYSRFHITGKLKEGVIRDTITDTSTIKGLEFFDRQYIFLVETRASRTFNPPNFDKEEILSYNVSGVKEPYFAALVNQFQTFSFYENTFDIGGISYINPIAPGGIRRYYFTIQDTLIHEETSDTTYTISYRPRINKNFDGLEGFLYINTKDWAFEKVIASPFIVGEGSALTKIIQEYAYTNDLKWFPKKISAEISLPMLTIDNSTELIGRSSLYIEDVKFNVDAKRMFNPVQVEVVEGALEDTLGLKNARGDRYTGKEELTYHFIDSVAEDANLGRYVELLKIATTGVIPIWKFGLPIDRIISYNAQEGIRLGLGVETNRRMSKIFNVGGYFAYGTKDKKWKWGGDLSFNLYRKQQIKIQFSYLEDIFQRGGTDFYNKSFFLTDETELKNFFRNVMDRERTARVNLSGLITPNMKVQLFGNYKRYWFIDDYRFVPIAIDKEANERFDIAEIGTVFSWNIRERVMMLDDQRISLESKWPKITIKAAKGISGIFESNYDYWRLNTEISQNFRIRGVGQIDLVATGGVTLGDVPLTLMQVEEGTGTQFGVFVANTFQTMLPAEFFTDRNASMFFYFSFLPLKNKTTWTEPQFVLYSAAGVGEMNNRNFHQKFDFVVPTKGFYESGLKIDNILTAQFVGIGIGAFYRYGAYQLPKPIDNLFGKITVTIGF
ncbi:MAG: DUF5686 family protein [Brumimicrobium sp.]